MMTEDVRKKCKIPVRFYPNQYIFIPWIDSNGNHIPCEVQVDRVVWEPDEITYEIQSISNSGHQWTAEIKDTWDQNCNAFNTKDECQFHIDNFKSEVYNRFDQKYFNDCYITVPFSGSL